MEPFKDAHDEMGTRIARRQDNAVVARSCCDCRIAIGTCHGESLKTTKSNLIQFILHRAKVPSFAGETQSQVIQAAEVRVRSFRLNSVRSFRMLLQRIDNIRRALNIVSSLTFSQLLESFNLQATDTVPFRTVPRHGAC